MQNTEITRNDDPDGLACYSDHANDIKFKGCCDFCGSTEVDAVGHVLPDTERLHDMDPVQAAAVVLHTKSYKIVDGVLLDYQTAHVIRAVYDALSEDARAKLRSFDITKAGLICWKLVAGKKKA